MCGVRLHLPGHLAIGSCTPRMLGCSVSMVCSPFFFGGGGGTMEGYLLCGPGDAVLPPKITGSLDFIIVVI